MNRVMETARGRFRKAWTMVRRVFPVICLSCGSMTAHASEGENGSDAGTYDFHWLTDGTHDNQAFSDLTTTVMDTGGSLYKLMMAIGAIGLLVSLIACGLMIAVGTNANKRSEHISHLMWVAVGGIVIFGAMSIIGLMQSIGGNI